MAKHGTRSKYTNEKCRCELCAAAQADYMAKYSKGKYAQWRAEFSAGTLVFKHGSEKGGAAGCRCGLCYDYMRNKNLKRVYGITTQEYDEMSKSQGDACALCGKRNEGGFSSGKGLVVDHDHSTGKIRGLLCPTCNTGLGKLGDSPESLQRALDYVKQ